MSSVEWSNVVAQVAAAALGAAVVVWATRRSLRQSADLLRSEVAASARQAHGDLKAQLYGRVLDALGAYLGNVRSAYAHAGSGVRGPGATERLMGAVAAASLVAETTLRTALEHHLTFAVLQGHGVKAAAKSDGWQDRQKTLEALLTDITETMRADLGAT